MDDGDRIYRYVLIYLVIGVSLETRYEDTKWIIRSNEQLRSDIQVCFNISCDRRIVRDKV